MVLLLVLATMIICLVGTTHWMASLLNRHVETLRTDIYQHILSSCVGVQPTMTVEGGRGGEVSSNIVRLNTFGDEISVSSATQTLRPVSNNDFLCNGDQSPGDQVHSDHGNIQHDTEPKESWCDLGHCHSTMHDSNSHDLPLNDATTTRTTTLLDTHWLWSYQKEITFHLVQWFQNLSKHMDRSLIYLFGHVPVMTVSSYPLISAVWSTFDFVFRTILVFGQVVMQCTHCIVSRDVCKVITGGFPVALFIVLWALSVGVLLHDGIARQSTSRLMNRGNIVTSAAAISRGEAQDQSYKSGNYNYIDNNKDGDDNDDDGYNSDNEDASWWHPPSPPLRRKRHPPPTAVRQPVRVTRHRSNADKTSRLSKREKLVLGRARAKQAWLDGRLGKKPNL
jgi:hypothetical protein